MQQSKRIARQLQRIRRYIGENPASWAYDRENPDAILGGGGGGG